MRASTAGRVARLTRLRAAAAASSVLVVVLAVLSGLVSPANGLALAQESRSAGRPIAGTYRNGGEKPALEHAGGFYKDGGVLPYGSGGARPCFPPSSGPPGLRAPSTLPAGTPPG